ncbi:MAG: cyanoexosortase B system-associated protein [Leptolyngbyaceae cyanobacterium CRU_2_3]|nr:cyanoexosortase B system-associated protein [Leptolyngbyaceae cyanobacterium CRU_2_3]
MTPQPLSSLAAPSQRSPLYKFLIVVFLLTIAAASAIPNYLSGNWFLNKVPELSNIRQLRAIQSSGLTLPDWQTLDHQLVEIGGHKWSVQAIAPIGETTTSPSTATLLMLRPQTWHRDLPQVDWVDISGVHRWTEDRDRQITFSIPSADASSPVQVNARFLRGWTDEQTYAVLQWYAWKAGGHSSPNRWFWVEQVSKLRDRQHTPWVAVSILMPIQPLGEIEAVQAQMQAIGRLVQSALRENTFK